MGHVVCWGYIDHNEGVMKHLTVLRWEEQVEKAFCVLWLEGIGSNVHRMKE